MASAGGSALRYKVAVMGDQYVGKSSIIRRYVRNEFSTTYINTPAGDFSKKQVTINGIDVILFIYDIAGQTEDMTSITENLYRHSDGVLLVFDFARESTLRHISDWLQLIKARCDREPEIVLLGNKIDLAENMREVKMNEAKEVGMQHDIHFIEGSAKRNLNIDIAFKILAKRIHEVKAIDESLNGRTYLYSNTRKSSTCCQ